MCQRLLGQSLLCFSDQPHQVRGTCRSRPGELASPALPGQPLLARCDLSSPGDTGNETHLQMGTGRPRKGLKQELWAPGPELVLD